MIPTLETVLCDLVDCALRSEGKSLKRKKGYKRDPLGLLISLIVQAELAKYGAANTELLRDLLAEAFSLEDAGAQGHERKNEPR